MTTTSWWVGLDRAAFYARARIEAERMRAEREGDVRIPLNFVGHLGTRA